MCWPSKPAVVHHLPNCPSLPSILLFLSLCFPAESIRNSLACGGWNQPRIECISFHTARLWEARNLEKCVKSVDMNVSEALKKRTSHPAACLLAWRGEINLPPVDCWVRSEAMNILQSVRRCHHSTSFNNLVVSLATINVCDSQRHTYRTGTRS